MVEDLCLSEGALQRVVVHYFLLEHLSGVEHYAPIARTGLEVSLVADFAHRKGELGPSVSKFRNSTRI